MLFSVLIPVYNVEKYLVECLESVLAQSFQDFEIVLIDDGSTDNSPGICDEYVKRYTGKVSVVHKENEGLILARRDAFKLAKGDYFINLDSDDFISKDMLERLAGVINDLSPDIILYDLFLYRSADDIVNVNGGSLPLEPGKLKDVGILREWLIDREYITWSMAGKCFKRSCIEIDKDYSGFKGIKYGEDTLQSCEVYDNARNFVYLTDRFYFYRAHSGMTSCWALKSIDDYFSLKAPLYEYAKKWKLKDEEDKAAYYVFYESYFFLLNMIENKLVLSEAKEKFEYLLARPEFIWAYGQLVPGDYYKEKVRWKMKLLLGLLRKKLFLLLFIFMKVKKCV